MFTRMLEYGQGGYLEQWLMEAIARIKTVKPLITAENLKILAKIGVDINENRFHSGTLLMKAVKNGDADIVKVLLEAGADTEDKDLYDWTPLIHAVWDKKSPIVKMLVKAGADVNARDFPTEQTPLILAACRGASASAKILLDAGADVHAKDDEGHTALFYAKDREHYIIADLIARTIEKTDGARPGIPEAGD